MRRLLASILAVLMILVSLSLPVGANNAVTEPPRVTARSAVLLDQATGRILFSKNAHEVLPMASTTKIMTAILALESGRLEDVVTVSEYASLVEGSGVDLEAGEEKTLEELVFGLILRSGNDAATAIAEHLGGSVEKFAVMMTRRAKELGAAQTKFMNPHGLHHEEHYTTAYDLALIAAHAMSIPKFQEVSATREIKISWTGKPYDRLLRNQNKLLTLYDGADGIKTGWTTPAGRCFVGSAARDDWRLISVVLNAPEMWEDAIRLMDFGYSFYMWENVVDKNQPLKTAAVKKGMSDKVTLVAGSGVVVPLKENEAELLRYHFEVREPLAAPIRAGQEVGALHIYFGMQRVADVPLLAAEEVEKRGLGRILRRFFGRWLPFAALD
jgi:D-alanyl-D-alanine carboxypeptidase (penicillin-binding protein 5/6)